MQKIETAAELLLNILQKSSSGVTTPMSRHMSRSKQAGGETTSPQLHIVGQQKQTTAGDATRTDEGGGTMTFRR